VFVDAYDEVKTTAEKMRPDLVFLELEPTSAMVDLCAELRTMDAARDVPIILVSDAPASEELVAGGLLAGADDYVSSSERPTEVRARVRVQLRNKRFRDALNRVRGEREAFRRQAAVDPLTGLLNRGSLSELISDKIIAGERFALLFVDVDHFKPINDHFGHATGDLVLKGIAEYLQYGMRSGDYCGRYGGEEFVIVAADVSPERAYRLAERHRAAIAALRPEQLAYPSQVTVSIGVAVYEPESGENSDELLDRADAALYTAKSTGRNRVVVAHEPETSQVRSGNLTSGFHQRFASRPDDAKTR
jgi:diguanylate cyclase (GGDEF)-like protein